MQTFKNPTGQKIITVANDENLEIFLEDLATGSRDFDLQILLEGEFSKAKVSGIAKTNGDDKKNWKVNITLQGKEQSGELSLRGVADDSSLLRFDGSGIVSAKSSGGEMKITENIVLFSPHARGHALPILRVETDDVKAAGHGATIAPFDEEMFFYLESRGITPQDAKQLLLEGFLQFSK